MDVPCRVCGEPLDMDCLHDVADELGLTFAQVSANYRTKGCAGLAGSSYENPSCTPRGNVAARGMVYDLLGDDIDGAAVMLEDMEASLWD